MGSFDIKSKKRIQLWKKAAIHFTLCFVMGFFSGFAPASTASLFSTQSTKNLGIEPKTNASLNRSLISQLPSESRTNSIGTRFVPRDPLIVVTTVKPNDRFKGPFLRRLAHTLKLVPPPLLWVVVEAYSDASAGDDLLRKSGVMYRHLSYKENFTDFDVEADHQRNVALNHIEYHRLNGIVHFADVSSVYDLDFFEEIREIDMFGAWPVVMVSAGRKRVLVEGPICSESKVVGWRLKDLSNETVDSRTQFLYQETKSASEVKPSKINISGFAFNSSILWDPERWGRPSSVLDTSQDSIKFVQEVILEDETKLKAIPSYCSKIMLWHLHIPRTLTTPQSTSQYQNTR